MKSSHSLSQTAAVVFSSLRKFISWAFLKLVFGAFIAVSIVAIYGLWLFQHDDPDFAAVRERHLANLTQEQVAAGQARDDAHRQLETLQKTYDWQQNRADKAAGLIETLRSMQSWWERLFGNREQQKLNASRIVALKAMEREARDAARKMQRELARATATLDACDHQLQAVGEQLHLAQETSSRVVYYLNDAWERGKWFVIACVCLYFFGPTLRKLTFYYYLAPRIARSRALQLSAAQEVFPSLEESQTVVETSLWPGETARVRKRYLLAVDDAAVRESRWLLSRRFPLTSLLSGFVHDVHLHNARAGREYRLAFAHHKNPEIEMAVVHVPEGGSLIVRPSHLAAVILPPGKKLTVQRRWQCFRWQSWLTGQLRFIEFHGPCRMVVAGRPGLRAERLTLGDDGTPPVSRASRSKAIAFTPNLEYRVVRTPRFWGYYRWNQPLFDARFVGVGFVLTQAPIPDRQVAFWSATRNRARKVFGL